VNRIVKISLVTMGGVVFACGGSMGIGAGGGGMGIGAGVSVAKTGDMGADEHRQSVEEWHAGRIKRLYSETGWLTLVGLFPLPEGVHTFGSADDNDLVFAGAAPAHAGKITVKNHDVHLDASKDAGLTHDNQPVTSLRLEADSGDRGEPTEIRMGTYDFYVIERQGNLYLRVKDTASEILKHFDGKIDCYPIDVTWRIPARFEKYELPLPIQIQNFIGYTETVQCPGALVFNHGGKEYRLEPMADYGEEWFIVFADATSGHDTYGGGRFVYVTAPDENGNTFIDFNRAYNPPCVFTPYATCPLPHEANVLPFKVEAGEKNYESH
jgi:uncharacterized protein (DUF1684 family)